MAKIETNISHRIMLALAGTCTLFKNVRGLFLTLDGSRKIRAGLQAEGASDLIGITKVIITPEMVGTVIGVFTAIEVKTTTGKAFKEQKDFITFVKENGGFAGVARCENDAFNIIINK